MPGWLRKQLEEGGKVTVNNQFRADGTLERVVSVANETRDIMPVLAQLCEQDQSVEEVFLCHPGVKHVVKMWHEGGFCGYRNIQMLISYIQAAESQGVEHFQGRLPTILKLQDLIEEAWDKGINSSGRIETGGIRGTRKYIGTQEVISRERTTDMCADYDRLKLCSSA
jgi:zinc finger-containing ubiquitin peptidase 1